MGKGKNNPEEKKHEHYWSYEHAVYDGRNSNEVLVHRYCACGVHQTAYASRWHKPSKKYELGV